MTRGALQQDTRSQPIINRHTLPPGSAWTGGQNQFSASVGENYQGRPVRRYTSQTGQAKAARFGQDAVTAALVPPLGVPFRFGIRLRASRTTPEIVAGLRTRTAATTNEYADRQNFPAMGLDWAWWVSPVMTITSRPAGLTVTMAAIFTDQLLAGDWFEACDAMLTLGTEAPRDFRNGDSPGWKWLGTAGASASVGYPPI